ncbi:hypothetical protein VTJ49DRAFT_1472 [Mycothermus thermophilus]|uniref:Amidase domain-containing protein n=1 Tax=Humicola insolens TaxID=85995 RepID=A0ABR3VDZ1_HUMIN
MCVSSTFSKKAPRIATLGGDVEIAVGDNFLSGLGFDDGTTALALAYTTVAGQNITRSALREFRRNVLDRDDVFQAGFCTNLIFVGAKATDFEIAPDAFDELAVWQPSKSRPLDGARISVKDNIDIAGHKTTLCNRAWTELYPVKTKTAACVQTLIDAGAIVLGKVKCQAMTVREEPLECVEFTAPFNPRADGYQVPSGSSSGSAAGIASYDWLNFSIGTDTGFPQWVFSIRPSTGVLDRDGVVGYFPEFDMPVFFGRDITRLSDFISVWNVLRSCNYPQDYLPTENPAQTRLIDNFVTGFEKVLGVERTLISLAEAWKQDLPDGPGHADIGTYLETAGIYPFYHDQ